MKATTQTTTKRQRHNCGGGTNQKWMTCTECGKRIHRQGCTSKLDPKKDCDLKCFERLVAKRDAGCECPVTCDCQSPEPPEGAALISEECPVHNLIAAPSYTCPVHGRTK